uniref:Myb-like domain-containing protein n=1 Tax=Peronospora matthiolae TaxID=2874970 RepID=A0AAV1V0R6_9STRA
METEVKRRLGPHVQRRGDGFTEAESMGMLQLVRSHWREGWDVVAQLHNQQFSKHNRSPDSLKKKFSRLYRSNVPLRGAKNYQAIAFAHVVHKEMVEGLTPAPGAAAVASSVHDEPMERSESVFHSPQDQERAQEGGGTESENSWTDTTVEVPPMTAAGVAPALVASAVPAAPSCAAVAGASRPQSRTARPSSEWKAGTAAAVFTADAHPLPSDDLLTSVLKVILRSQYQRDLDREEERIRRAEERQRRREEAEQRRQEEEQRRDEERDERRRRSEERAEERDENRRRHEQFMQMMMLLVGKKDTAQHRDTDC